MIDQHNERFIRTLEASQRVAAIGKELTDPETGPDELAGLVAEQRDLEERLRNLLSADLKGLTESAEEVAVDIHNRVARKLIEADQDLGALRSLAQAAELWAGLLDREARVGFGTDLVDAARSDVRKVLVPLPVLELIDRRKKND